MIDLKGMISIQLLKKEAFTGSDKKLRFRLYKETKDEKDVIAATYWTGEYCWEATAEEEKTTEYYDFTTDGIWDAVKWLNEVSEQVN